MSAASVSCSTRTPNELSAHCEFVQRHVRRTMTTESQLLGPADIRNLAAGLDLTPTKRHGQNFVIDPNTVRRIVRLAKLQPDDVVVEVGPGLGSLTLGLLSVAREVVAIEIDDRLAGQLPKTVTDRNPAAAKQLRVITADALTATSETLGEPPPTAFVANLPYNVAVPIVLHLLATLPEVTTGLVMVQLEVAARLAASPGSRIYGVPSVKMQWFGSVESVGTVGPKVFWPEPRVDSGLVRFVRGSAPTCETSRQQVFAAIDAGFSQRRKKLRSALSTWAGGLPVADSILAQAGIHPDARGEDLTLAEFAAISDARSRLVGT